MKRVKITPGSRSEGRTRYKRSVKKKAVKDEHMSPKNSYSLTRRSATDGTVSSCTVKRIMELSGSRSLSRNDSANLA